MSSESHQSLASSDLELNSHNSVLCQIYVLFLSHLQWDHHLWQPAISFWSILGIQDTTDTIVIYGLVLYFVAVAEAYLPPFMFQIVAKAQLSICSLCLPVDYSLYPSNSSVGTPRVGQHYWWGLVWYWWFQTWAKDPDFRSCLAQLLRLCHY